MSFIAVAIGGSAIASVVGGVIGSKAAGHAADTQASAATNAAQIQAQSADKALAEQQRQFNIQQQNLAPWLNVGRSGLANLSYLTGTLPHSQSSTLNAGGSVPMSTLGTNGPGYQPAPATSNLRTADGPYSQMTDAGLPDGFGGVTPDSGGGQIDPNSPALGNPTGSGQNVDLNSLVNPSLGAEGSLLAPWTQKFEAPTDVTEQNDPGFQFRLQQGEKALQSSAAAHGNLLTGGTAKALQRYGQDYASNEYNNVYNRSLGQYQQNYNIFKQNQNDQFNRLAAISGVGQTSAGQLNQASQNYGTNAANIIIGSGNAQAQGINNAAAARASGYVGGANALSSGISGGIGTIGNYLTLQSLLGNRGGLNQVPGITYDQYQGMGG